MRVGTSKIITVNVTSNFYRAASRYEVLGQALDRGDGSPVEVPVLRAPISRLRG